MKNYKHRYTVQEQSKSPKSKSPKVTVPCSTLDALAMGITLILIPRASIAGHGQFRLNIYIKTTEC